MGEGKDTAAVHRWPGDAGSLSPAAPLSPSPQRSTDGGKTFTSCNVSPKVDLRAVAVVPGSTTTAWAVGNVVSSKTVSCWCGMTSTQRGGPARCKFPAARSTPQATASSSSCRVQVVLKTTDAGATWAQQSATNSLPSQPVMSAISMLDANVFYMAGNSGT